MCAQACVDSALWDAVGKALDTPLYKIWGGFRDSLQVICIAGYYEEGKTLADFGREMEWIKTSGYAGCKFKVGGRTPAEDALRVRTARAAVGEDFVLTVDANQG
jgi:D-arabinonate dehydratase